MDPNQPAPPQPSQYDFITNPQKPPRRGLKGLSGGGKGNKLVIVVGGLIILTFLVLVYGLVFGGSDNEDVLLSVARKQSQVIALAEQGADDGGTNQAKSLGLAVKLSVTTQQQAVLRQIQPDGKVNSKDYAAGLSSDVTSQLENGEKNGRFDEVFNNVMADELEDYQQQLKSAYSSVSGESTQKLLSQDFESVALLLKIPQ